MPVSIKRPARWNTDLNMFEVEQKFRLPSPAAFLSEIAALGLRWQKKVVETDTYFQHPSRDFVKTDEAFRVRRHLVFFADPDGKLIRAETESLITFKGPRLDRETKTRKEIELPLAVKAEAEAERFADVPMPPMADCGAKKLWETLDALPETQICAKWFEMLALLGFRQVHSVRKIRSKAYWQWDGAPVEISCDEVYPIGTFAELEFIAKNEEELPAVREKLLNCSKSLKLTEVEPRSYLALVLEHEKS